MGADARKSCVIGGAGFIGAHVTRLLADSGRKVTVLGRRTKPPECLPAGVAYVSGNYGDREVLKSVLSGMAEVIDLAYSTVPQASFVDPVFDIVSNIPPSVVLFEEAVAANVRRLVFVSSGGTVYGPVDRLPISEEQSANPISPYGITKLAIEKYAGMFQRIHNLPVVVVRPGNAYGEEQRPFAGQGFIATAVHSIIRGEEVGIYGDTGTIRDYVHVSDIASAIVAALEKGEEGNIYNIGTGVGLSNINVLQAIELLASADGYAMHMKMLPARKFDVPANVLDSGRLRTASGWQPKVEFNVGIERVWRSIVAAITE